MNPDISPMGKGDNPEKEKQEKPIEKTPKPQPPKEESIPPASQPQSESEQERAARAEEVRRELDAAYGDESESNTDQRKKAEQATEDRIAIINASRTVIDILQTLFSSLARNKFPRVGFDFSELAASITKETIDERAIASALLNMSRSLNRITMPDDFQDRMQIRPENFKAVIRILEELKDDLLFLRNAFSKAQSQNLENLSTEVNRVRGIVEKRIDDLGHFQRLRQKVSDRGY